MKVVVKRALLLLLLISFWWLMSQQVNNLFVPQPLNVLNAFFESLQSGMLVQAFLYSIRRILIATCLSASIAFPFGILIHNYRILQDFIYPITNVMRYLPVTAFYPLLIMYFGIEEEMKIAFLFVATFVYMMPSVMLALDEVNEELIDTGKTMGMSKVQTIIRIQIPAILPSVCNSFIMMFGIGWTYIAVVESINAVYGLGYIIQQSSARGRTDLVFMSIIVIMLICIIFDTASKKVVRKIFSWRYLDASD